MEAQGACRLWSGVIAQRSPRHHAQRPSLPEPGRWWPPYASISFQFAMFQRLIAKRGPIAMFSGRRRLPKA